LAPDGHVNYAALVALGVGLAMVSVRKASGSRQSERIAPERTDRAKAKGSR
jgi:hypothetical protein